MAHVHPLPASSRICEDRNRKSPDHCKHAFPLPGFGLGIAAAAVAFSAAQALSLGEPRLGWGEMALACVLAIWAGLH